MKREVRDFLNDILLYAEKAEEIVAQNPSGNLTQFSTEGMALMLCIQIIGEAVKNIPEELRAKSSDIPWREIAGMRDRLTHNYWNTSMQKVRDTVTNRLPTLRTNVQRILEDLQ